METRLNRYTHTKTGLVYWRLFRGKALLVRSLKGFKTDDAAVKNAAVVLRALQTIPVLVAASPRRST